ncbi:hypothetical protein ABFS83_06G020600 [Erythranthe nasuta]
MIPNPDQIQYACIAKGTTVLAEFNSKDAALGAIAAKCLNNAPSLHATFTHTVRSKTYTFLIDEPLVYFVIFDEKLEKSEGLAFLRSVRDAFSKVLKGERKLEKLSSHCYQGEFNPVFRQLLGPALYHMEIGSPTGRRIGQSGLLQSGSGPIRDRGGKPNGEKGLTKMKNQLLGQLKIGWRNGEKENDENGGSGIGLSREFSMISDKSGGGGGGCYSGELKAKNVWKKQVWVVLSLDLIFCAILFAVWLWVCSGFQCMAS